MKNHWGFTFTQVQWVLDNYIDLSHGTWPDSEVAECDSRSPLVSARARFENPAMLAGEVGARVKKCGFDGMATRLRYGIDRPIKYEPKAIAEGCEIPLEKVEQAIRKVTWYCTSERGTHGARRVESYRVWRNRTRSDRHFRA